MTWTSDEHAGKSERRWRWETTLAYSVGILASMTILAVGMLVCYWLYWPQTPFTWNSPNALVVNGPVRAGSYVNYHVNVCKNKDDVMVVQRDLVAVNGSAGYPLAPVNNVVKNGCGKAVITMFIPPTIPPGIYIMRDAVTWKANPLRSVTSTTTSPPFLILAESS